MGSPERVSREKDSLVIPGLNPIRYEMRSALFYGTVWAIKRLGRLALGFHGFVLREFAGGIECWFHLPRDIDTSQPPIVFFPGIGFGPMQYLDHLRQVQERHPNRPIFVLSSSHTALSAAAEIATEFHVLAAVDCLMAEHRFDKFSLIGHSFGTLLAALVANCRPSSITHFTLIDPICFMFWEASLLYTSQFATPDSSLQYVAVRFITKDPLFAAAYARLMYFPCNGLLPENIPCPADIYLSNKDWAIDPQRVQSYLLHRKEVSQLETFNVHMFDVAHQEYMLVPEAYNHINNVI
ncbi:hypothetical protein DSO57_1000968 [Entomophthora muscae]|uniref:Uncharacterized protein n=1 Tax=Entomophthora muscae TaxID=34485 RepID=A0ACC2UJP6_9FUNG|nr:hypothetical protein DSO57_1000968 [Entomophthora muscae]